MNTQRFAALSLLVLSLGLSAVASSVNVNLDSEIEVKGYSDTSKAEKTVDIKLYHLRNCYMEAVKKKVGLKGKMELHWNIDEEGAVVDPTVASSTVKNATMDECMISSVKEWKFPKPDKENAGVTLKLTLSGTSKE